MRRFYVFAGRDPALTIEDRPGRLYSMAALPEGATAPEHPFVDGVSHNALSEHALRGLLLESTSFDAFVQRLVAAGYDLAATGEDSPFHIGTPRRLRSPGGTLAGALWNRPGPFATLASPAGQVLPVRVTAYDADAAGTLAALLATAHNTDAALDALEDAGWRLEGPGLPG